MEDSPIKFMLGLGNPVDEYSNTRHNVGRWFVDALAAWHHVDWQQEKKFHGKVTKVHHEDSSIWLLAPNTFMNLSGDALGAMARFYGIAPESILVVHDDLDFPAGVVRLKQGGGHGGHNGLRHIKACLSGEFWRIRLGIGHPGHKDLVHDYVLHAPSRSDDVSVREAIEKGMSILPSLFIGNFQLAVRQLHQEV